MLFTQGMNQQAIMTTCGNRGSHVLLAEYHPLVSSRRRGKITSFSACPTHSTSWLFEWKRDWAWTQAMRKVSEEMKKTYVVIAEEFSLCNLQLQMGRARNEVLHELGSRTGVDDLKALSAILIQADKIGSSIAQALRVQSDSMRTRRKQMAEEKAAKTAVKLNFPLVLFIFPALFIVLVGPAAITMINEMFPAMNGTG